ncbi:MAG: peptide ABC transporter substrate-binding protein [Alphaproteobacteria bacterium]|nr:peptide ABC transporter substrate-binding protein [Alphaproteobacteria bacterium]
MTDHRTTTRKAAIGLLTATAIGLAGLAGHAGLAPLAAAELRVANSGEPDSLDPHHTSGVWESRILRDMFMGLTTEAADATVVPGAAESWTVSDDGLVYTFTIRDHVWSDGTPVTAGDFVYSLQRILKPETAAQYASLLYSIKNAQALNEGSMDNLEDLGVKALDDKTLEITLEYPAPYFLEQLTHQTAYPVPKHKIEEHGDDWIKAGNLVGNGAYVLEEWVPNTHVRIVKDETFYDAANVAIDAVMYYPAEERNAATKQFRAGEIDVQTDFASEQIDWLNENLPDETRITPYLGIYYYSINTSKPPFDDARVRNALAMSIDRTAITDKVLKTGELPGYSFVPPDAGDYGEPSYVAWKDTPYEERVEQAKALLADAGYGPDRPLEFQLRYNTSENHKKIAIAVAAMWKQLGVQTELFNAEVKVHYNDLQEGNFDIARAGWIADYNDPQNFLYLMEGDTGANNYTRFDHPEYNELMDKSDYETNPAARNELMHQAEAIAMAEMPNIPIYYYVSKNLVSKRVQGWVDNAADRHPTRYLSLAD